MGGALNMCGRGATGGGGGGPFTKALLLLAVGVVTGTSSLLAVDALATRRPAFAIPGARPSPIDSTPRGLDVCVGLGGGPGCASDSNLERRLLTGAGCASASAIMEFQSEGYR